MQACAVGAGHRDQRREGLSPGTSLKQYYRCPEELPAIIQGHRTPEQSRHIAYLEW